MIVISGLILTALFRPLEIQAAQNDRSDLNNDFSVDTLDLEIFSNRYLEQDWQSVDWCQFLDSSLGNEQYFRRLVSANTVRFDRLLNFVAESYNCDPAPRVNDKSDLNADAIVDLADLAIFSTNYLQTHWENVDWCLFRESTITGTSFGDRPTRYFLRHFRLLLAFINDYFACTGGEPPADALRLENTPLYLTRIAAAANSAGDYYITDPRLGSLFIYGADLVPKAEIKGLDRPLGVAFDAQGYLLIGNDGRDNIEVYNPANGELLAIFGEDLVKMPNAISVDSFGIIYVTDSLSNNVRVFDTAYNPIGVIGKSGEGEDELKFPVDAEVVVRHSDGVANIEEIYVADQGNNRLQVYDLQGNWLRGIEFDGKDCNWFTGECAIPPFGRLQALDTDSFGRLHVLDNFEAAVLVFNPADDSNVGAYHEYGEGPGYLRVPMDLLITSTDTAIVTSGDGSRIEVLAIP